MTVFRVVFTVAAGTTLASHSCADQWIRVADDSGRSGCIATELLARRR